MITEKIEFDPSVGTGAALAEFYFNMADAAALIGEPDLADAFWQAGAAAAHPTSS